MKKLALLFCLLCLACAPEVKTSDAPIEPILYERGENLRRDGDAWQGTGRLMFASQLRSQRDTFHVVLAGQLLEPQSVLTLHLFLDDFQYDTGIQLRFRPSEIEGGSSGAIDVEFKEPGYSFKHLAMIENSLAPGGNFRLRIEAINRLNNDRRLLIWNDQIQVDSQQRRPRDKIIEGNADYDSNSQGTIFFRWGQGLGWGISLVEARLTTIKREAPFVDL